MTTSTTPPAVPFFIDAPGGHRVCVRLWTSNGAARGIVHWCHGMAEHGGRYEALAAALNSAGWHLCVHDHRGHGGSISDSAPLGHFGDREGWDAVLSDVQRVRDHLAPRFPGLPYVLGGHSMGSFVALAYAERCGHDRAPQALVLCGSNHDTALRYRLALLPISWARWRAGARGSSPLISKLTFDTWARSIHPRRTEFDWLSTDPATVDAYLADPLCGFDCSTQLWHDLLSALVTVHSPAGLARLPSSLPIWLMGGRGDPMSRHGKGMVALARHLRRAGAEQVTLTQYDGRHEILNDHCQQEARGDLLQWLGKVPNSTTER
ncbi:alpha/beta fold hydrolase [Isoalcanivorax beigongshangi]|uniref:Alpha/beta fold hydrolase n=1 Tax=Isoalcanivorax beigongshangi TaxID=3238810 RepID=A0ABV4AH01_9GAMM